MKFTDEQQTYLDDLIAKTYTKAYQKAATAAATARTTELETQLTLAWEKARDSELKAAAAQHGAYNPTDVAFLLKDSVKIAEDGEFHVIDKAGARRHDREGNPLTIAVAVQDYLDKNTHLVKAVSSSGSGGTGFFGGLFGKER